MPMSQVPSSPPGTVQGSEDLYTRPNRTLGAGSQHAVCVADVSHCPKVGAVTRVWKVWGEKFPLVLLISPRSVIIFRLKRLFDCLPGCQTHVCPNDQIRGSPHPPPLFLSPVLISTSFAHSSTHIPSILQQSPLSKAKHKAGWILGLVGWFRGEWGASHRSISGSTIQLQGSLRE